MCEWFGVTCSSDHITAVVLDGNGLQGTIPSSISDLSMLEYVALYQCCCSAVLAVLATDFVPVCV